MQLLHILISRHYDFNQTHYTEIWLRSIQSELANYFNVKISWLLYLPDKIILDTIPNEENVEYIQDFRNAVELIRKLKPDLIITNEYPSLIDLALFAASKNSDSFFIKHNSEPIDLDLTSKNSSTVKIQSHTPFFSSLASLFRVPSMPQLSEKNHTTFHRVKFLLQKFNFLASTLFFSKLQFIEKWNILLAGLGHLYNPHLPYINPKLIPDLDFCNSSILYNLMKSKNYSHSGLHIVGEPIYDNLFKKRTRVENSPSKKIKVLFAPTAFSEKNSSQHLVENAISKISKTLSEHKNKFSFSVKLHPSSHPIDYYKKYIHAQDSSIPIFQKGSLESYVENCDVFISFTQVSSAIIYPMILRKPVIFCNFYNEQLSDGIKKLVFVCTKPSELSNLITVSHEKNHTKYSDIDNYLELSCYKTDGFASKRIVDSIISLLNNNSIK
jgi:hypothetical protein